MLIVGIDEVGRGCWAGPLVAGAVVLDEPIPGLRDSKKLSKNRRRELSLIIQEQAVDCGLGWVEPFEVDMLGLTLAVQLAMQRSVDALAGSYTEIIIDGNYNFLPHLAGSRALIKADDLIPAVSAASILAKVARDDYMQLASIMYPEYGFAGHVGYGTAEHRSALQKYGPCKIHRKSYKPIQALLK